MTTGPKASFVLDARLRQSLEKVLRKENSRIGNVVHPIHSSALETKRVGENMSFARKTASIALAALILSPGVAFAQAGGADVPSDAQKQGEKEIPGSTGMNKSGNGSMQKDKGSMREGGGSMKKDGDKM